MQSGSQWYGDVGADEPLVSICCITFNHEKYLRQALDSFLIQETSFPVEILIHDDASTDATPDIVREYVARYPGRIRAILQEINHYSQDIQIFPMLFEGARGKYISWCEGDDFFTDATKLRRQVEFLEKHADYSLTTHEGVVVSDRGLPVGKVEVGNVDRRLTTEEVIEGGGGMVVTNSMTFRSEFVRQLPDYYYECAVEDYPMAIHLALSGNVHYMSRPMAAYRAAHNNWTHVMARDPRARLSNHENVLDLLSSVDRVSDGQFRDAVDQARVWHEFEMTTLTGRMEDLSDPRFASLYSDLPLTRRAWFRFRTRFPRLGSQIVATKREVLIKARELMAQLPMRSRDWA